MDDTKTYGDGYIEGYEQGIEDCALELLRSEIRNMCGNNPKLWQRELDTFRSGQYMAAYEVFTIFFNDDCKARYGAWLESMAGMFAGKEENNNGV